jgi:hypothetical protein
MINPKSLIITLVICLGSFVAGYFVRGLGLFEGVYTLQKPLRITTDDPDNFFALPSGTVLYLDSEPKEGGYDRYRVYINVFGRHLETSPTPKLNYIAPLTSFQSE